MKTVARGPLIHIQPHHAPQWSWEQGKRGSRDCDFSAWLLSQASLAHPSVTLATVTIPSQLLKVSDLLDDPFDNTVPFPECLSLGRKTVECLITNGLWVTYIIHTHTHKQHTHEHTHGYAHIHRDITHFYSCMQTYTRKITGEPKRKGKNTRIKWEKQNIKMQCNKKTWTCCVWEMGAWEGQRGYMWGQPRG